MGNSNNSVKLLSAVLMGAAIGGVLGILFAPDKGSETRKKISDKGHELTDAMKDKIKEYTDEFRKEAENVKGKAKDMVENGASAVEKFRAT